MFNAFDDGNPDQDNPVPAGLARYSAQKQESEKDRLGIGKLTNHARPVEAISATVAEFIFSYGGKRLWRLYASYVIRQILEAVRARVNQAQYRAFLKGLYYSIGKELIDENGKPQ